MKSATIHAHIELNTKIAAEAVLHQLGMTPTEAIQLFYTQISLQGGLPFTLKVPNRLTQETLAKSARGEDVEEFSSLDDLFASWEE